MQIIQIANTSEFKSHCVPYQQGLVPYMFTDESNKPETYTYVRTKLKNKF